MTFWDGAGTPVASVSASHKSFNSGSCPSCAVKVMLCLVVPETDDHRFNTQNDRES